MSTISISIHAPQWGATAHRRSTVRTPPYFNPRTPVGCDRDGAIGLAVTDISIHAPQWGATVYLIKNQVTKGISIHAPQWGATLQIPALMLVWVISIHAPQWGATEYHDVRHVTHSDFNPRTPVGCDGLSRQWTRRWTGYFNPRTPVGCDTRQYPPSFAYSTFRSTHPSGVRLIL